MRSSHKSRYKGKQHYKFPNSILLTSTIILSLCFIFFITYKFFTYTSYKNFKSSIATEINSIQEINSSTESLKDYSKNLLVDDAKSQLPSIRNNLLGVYTNIENISPPNEFIKSYNYLLEGLDFNIKIIKEAIFIVNNPKSSNLEISLESLTNYKSKSSKAYLLSDFENLNIFLPKEFNEFIDSLYSFTETSISNNKAELLLKEERNKYIVSIEDLFSSFKVIYNKHDSYNADKTDSKFNIKKHESLISSVEEDRASLVELIDILKTINPPEDGIAINNSLDALFISYDSYLQSYYDALTTEKSLHKPFSFKKQDYSYLYTDSSNLLKSTHALVEDFMIKLSKFKTK